MKKSTLFFVVSLFLIFISSKVFCEEDNWFFDYSSKIKGFWGYETPTKNSKITNKNRKRSPIKKQIFDRKNLSKYANQKLDLKKVAMDFSNAYVNYRKDPLNVDNAQHLLESIQERQIALTKMFSVIHEADRRYTKNKHKLKVKEKLLFMQNLSLIVFFVDKPDSMYMNNTIALMKYMKKYNFKYSIVAKSKADLYELPDEVFDNAYKTYVDNKLKIASKFNVTKYPCAIVTMPASGTYKYLYEEKGSVRGSFSKIVSLYNEINNKTIVNHVSFLDNNDKK